MGSLLPTAGRSATSIFDAIAGSIASASSTSTRLRHLSPATTHTLIVRARDNAGNVSGFEQHADRDAAGEQRHGRPRRAPSNLTAEDLNDFCGSVILRWGQSTDNVDPQSALEYEIYRNGVFFNLVTGTGFAGVYAGDGTSTWTVKSPSTAPATRSAASNAATVTVVDRRRTSAERFRRERRVPCDRAFVEAATPLRQPRVHVLMGRVHRRERRRRRSRDRGVPGPPDGGGRERGRRSSSDAIEVGARVLEREQAAVDAEFVRNEFEKVSREVETAFTDKARVVAEFFGTKVDEVFGAEDGHLAKELRRLFGEGSTRRRAAPAARRSCSSSPRGCARTCCASSPPPTAPTRWRTSRPRTCARRATPRRARRRSWRRCASRWSR